MRVVRTWLIALSFAGVAGAGSVGAARAQTVPDAVRAGQWGVAEALAAASPDPLAGKLVLYSRLLSPGAARAAEIAAFMGANPDWPNQALLFRRLQEALVVDKDDRTVLAICQARPPTAIPSLLRCAEGGGGAAPDDGAARRAWITGIADPPAETAFLKRWGGQITADDQWKRFDRLAWIEPAGPPGPAARQAARLPPGLRAAAEVRMNLRHDAATGPAQMRALPEASRADPAMVYELARWYRRAGQDRDAAAVWADAGVAAEQSVGAEHRGAFWDERNLLARRLLRADEAGLAFTVAATPAAGAEAAIDSAFLAGWIALRRLNQPAVALPYFNKLAGSSGAAITQARAHYWLGRTHAALGDGAAAMAAFRRAAAWPTAYYGQLAALELDRGGAALRAQLSDGADPGWTDQGAEAFLAQDTVRAAVLLTAWGEKGRAKAFLARLDELAETPVQRALAARLALGLGLPEQAVAIARRAGRDGVMLPGAGWPLPPSVQAVSAASAQGGVDPSVVLGVIRQESSFDVGAMSPVGARGLMQLMPATAAQVARKLGVAADVGALTSDAGYNVRLGTAYLQGLIERFGRVLPYAIAGYNAGPSRVADWQVGFSGTPGDPVSGTTDMVDWIEMIPFNETRNYVQRVIENIVVYRAQLGATGPHPTERQEGRQG